MTTYATALARQGEYEDSPDVKADTAKSAMNIRMYADNVLVRLDPMGGVTASGLHLVDTKSEFRTGEVIASGPGWTTKFGVLVANETRAGDRVIVHRDAGSNTQDWRSDLSEPRHNKYGTFKELFAQPGEFRVIREEEVAGIVESEAAE